MKKTVSLLLCLLLLAALALPACGAEYPALSAEAEAANIMKYGNVVLSLTKEELLAAGYAYGDVVTVSFLEQTMDLPLCSNYSDVDAGSPGMFARDADTYVLLAINMGDFATTYGLAVKTTHEDKSFEWNWAEGVTGPVSFTICMKEPGGYRSEYLLHKLSYTDDRADYPDLSDAQFANFRAVETTGMGKGVLYRCASPINPEHNRNAYADAAIRAAGVTVVMNLADDEATARAYPGFDESYYAGTSFIALNMGVDFTAAEFREKLAEGLRFFAEHPGVYAVHCTEGKDRAGFVAAMLECLMGASWQEVAGDYMRSFTNYYGVTPGEERYDAVLYSGLTKSLSAAFGVSDPESADLSACAAAYLKDCGLTDETLAALKANLSAAPASAADTAFTDVAADAYYADAVAWAAEKKITTGRGNGIFDPDATVSRAEAVTFLWRMAGEPAPAKKETFADVDADANNWWYKTAVQWAVAEGITNGTGNGFDPYMTCSRGMILTMLYRLKGEPFKEAMAAEIPENEEEQTLEDFGYSIVQNLVNGIRSENAIPDIKEGDWFELPVIWAELMGILREDQVDAESGAAHPLADCPRGEMVVFLYRASGDAPAEGAVKTGKIPETVLFDADGVKLTATGIKPEGLTDAIVECTVVNGSEKTLRVDASELYVNTYVMYPQVCIPTQSEDGFTFYADAVVAPGQTQDVQLRLNSLNNLRIDTVYEIELKAFFAELEEDGEGSYNYVDAFAEGNMVSIQTSLYDENASYDLEGTVLMETDGLKVVLLGAENKEYSGPDITLFVYNGSGEDMDLDLAELKFDGVASPGYFGLTKLPAGKRGVADIGMFIEDFNNIPVVKEAEFALQTMDPDTWEPKTVFDPVKVTFAQ